MNAPLCFAVAVTFAVAAQAQTTTRVSLGVFSGSPSQGSFAVSLSADGAFVAFQSISSTLVPGDTNAVLDVFVHNLATNQVERVSVSSSGSQAALASAAPSISGDGRYVAFSTFSADLVSGDTNGMSDIFVRDRLLGVTERVSVSTAGDQSNQQSYHPSISGDGRFIAFQSGATNLVAGADGGHIFVRDRVTSETTVVSVDSSGQLADSGAYDASISADGRFVAFQSAATNLTPGDAVPGAGGNGWDVFVHDRVSAVTQLVSATPAGSYPNGSATNPAISGDGRYVAFQSGASNIVAGDGPGSADVFVRDLTTQQTVRASEVLGGGSGQGNASEASLSFDGRYVAFASNMPGLAAQLTWGTSHIYRHDFQTGATELVSVSACGVPGSGITSNGYSNSHAASISGDGSRVAYASFATTLVPEDLNNKADLFLRDFSVPVHGLACAFCRSATTSSGCTPSMTTTGIPSASSGGGFVVSVVGTEGGRMGIAFYNTAAYYPQLWQAGSTSYLCMNAAGRLAAQISTGTQGQCDGVHAWDWTAVVAANPNLTSMYVAGRPVFMQSWFRDPPAPTGTNLSNGVQFVMQP